MGNGNAQQKYKVQSTKHKTTLRKVVKQYMDVFNLIGQFVGPDRSSSKTSSALKHSSKNNNNNKSSNSQYCGIICFSKDRPFQLHCLLSSINEYLVSKNVIIYVIYTCGEEWIQSYNYVFGLHSHVIPILETEFIINLQYCLKQFLDNNIFGVIFCVDDMIFTSSIELRYLLYMYMNNTLTLSIFLLT